MKRIPKKSSWFKVYIDAEFNTGHFNVWPAFFIYIKKSPVLGKGLFFEFQPFNAALGIGFVIKNHSK